MGYRFRLTFCHKAPGFFRLEDEKFPFFVREDLRFELVARDADKLSEATCFHVEGKGFSDEYAARSVGNHLRLRLQIVNGMLNLGLNIPTVDGTNSSVSPVLREDFLKSGGGVVVDGIEGLGVFPDDESYFELIASGKFDTHPVSDSTYILKVLSELWSLDMALDNQTIDALEIMGRAIPETSIRTKYLLLYLALERLVNRAPRGEAARKVIAELQQYVKSTGLAEKEANSLVGSIGNLNEQSFSSALMALVDRIKEPEKVGDQPLRKFLSDCIKARNLIAHNASVDPELDLEKLSNGLQNFILRLIWSRNNIPSFSTYRPASAITFQGMTIRFK